MRSMNVCNVQAAKAKVFESEEDAKVSILKVTQKEVCYQTRTRADI